MPPFVEADDDAPPEIAAERMGTYRLNVPGSRFDGFGPWTTVLYAEFENWNQYGNLIWNEDGTYRGNLSEPDQGLPDRLSLPAPSFLRKNTAELRGSKDLE